MADASDEPTEQRKSRGRRFHREMPVCLLKGTRAREARGTGSFYRGLLYWTLEGQEKEGLMASYNTISRLMRVCSNRTSPLHPGSGTWTNFMDNLFIIMPIYTSPYIGFDWIPSPEVYSY